MNNNFEANIERLNQIIKELESNDVSLDESIKLYQEGIELTSSCYNKINEVEEQSKRILAEHEMIKAKEVENNE